MTEKSKRKYYTYEQKLELLNQMKISGMTHAEFARRRGIHPVTIYQWKKMMGEKINKVNPDIEEILLENEKLKNQVKHLKETVGELSIDKKILETAVDIYKKSQLKEKYKSQNKSSKK